MKISHEQEQELEDIYQSFLHDEKIMRMKEIPMHRGSNCYEHCFKVAKLAIKRALRHKKGSLEVVLLASILHDYYLYDWHLTDEGHGLHGFSHSNTAMENAINHFGIGKRTQAVIESHMWPLTFTKIPKSREAWIVCIADKCISTKETLLCR